MARVSALVVCGCSFSVLPVMAGEIEPRAYVNTPTGVNFLLAGYVYSDGEQATMGASPLKDANLTMNTALFAYAHSFALWGNSAKCDVVIPYSELSGTAKVNGQTLSRQITGANDPRFRFSYNLYGAPAMSVEEFKDYQQDLLIGASVQVSAPLGQYDKTRLVNLGNNRWFIKPDIGISKAWDDFTLELSGGAFFFTDNDSYFGGKNFKQDPVYTGQVHATYNIYRGLWTAVSYTYDYGGRTSVNGSQNDDLQQNSRLGLTVALPVNRNNSVKLYASTSLHTTIGNDFDIVGIVWQYRWGGGL